MAFWSFLKTHAKVPKNVNSCPGTKIRKETQTLETTKKSYRTLFFVFLRRACALVEFCIPAIHVLLNCICFRRKMTIFTRKLVLSFVISAVLVYALEMDNSTEEIKGGKCCLDSNS
jgi:hypothetical protein